MDGVPVDDYQYEQQAIHFRVIASTDTGNADMVKINELFEQGNTLIARENYLQAIIVYDKGIALMGARYLSSQIIDDTEMKLISGNAEQKQGHLKRAARLKQNVLASRIHIYKKRLLPKVKTEGKDE